MNGKLAPPSLETRIDDGLKTYKIGALHAIDVALKYEHAIVVFCISATNFIAIVAVSPDKTIREPPRFEIALGLAVRGEVVKTNSPPKNEYANPLFKLNVILTLDGVLTAGVEHRAVVIF